MDRISKLRPLANELFNRVLGLDVSRSLLTDQSTLSDFTFGHPVEPLVRRIHEEFGVDVSAVEDGNVAEILERVAEKRKSQPAADA